MTILSVGEILWDVYPDGREELGGAPLNLAFHATRFGHEALFVSAVGDDSRGFRALQKATKLGVDPEFISTVPETATGTVKVTLNETRQPSFALERPAAYDYVRLSDRQLQAIAAAGPQWICFGTLFFGQGAVDAC
jgi:fructokinase